MTAYLGEKNLWPLPQHLTTDPCSKKLELFHPCYSPVCLTVTMSHHATCQRGLEKTEHTTVSHSALRGVRVSVHVKGALLVHRGCWCCTWARKQMSHPKNTFPIHGSCSRESTILHGLVNLMQWEKKRQTNNDAGRKSDICFCKDLSNALILNSCKHELYIKCRRDRRVFFLNIDGLNMKKSSLCVFKSSVLLSLWLVL